MQTTASSCTTTSDSAIVKWASGGEKTRLCSRRRGGVAVVAVLALVLTLLAANAFAASLGAFTGIASGVSGGSSLCKHVDNSFCPNDGRTCRCVPFTGTGKASVIGSFTLSTTVVLIGDVGECSEAVGAVTLKAKNGKDILAIDYHGFVCALAAGPSGSFALNANYVVNGANSGGKFAGASGSGNIAGAEDFSSGNMTGNANGTLLP